MVGGCWCHEPALDSDPATPRAPLPVALSSRSTHATLMVLGVAPSGLREAEMDVVYPRCCGLDIHKKLVVACRVVPGPTGTARKEVRSFGTTTAAIEELVACLAAR